MATMLPPDHARRPRGPVVWRVLVWLLLLLSAFGSLQYFAHAERTWQRLQSSVPLDPAELTGLHGVLGWDVAYLLASFALIVICAGCVLRQAWARPSMRVAAGVLALWLLVSGGLQWRDLHELAANTPAILAQAQQQGAINAVQILARLQRGYVLALIFKVVGLLALAWLAVMLDRPAVKAEFRTRR